MSSSPTSKQSDPRRQIGRAGELLAAEHLVRLGFVMLEHNFRTRFGELDLIAYDGRQIVFCEVKTRLHLNSRFGRLESIQPLEALDERKRHQVRRIAGQWLAARPSHPRADRLRFDAIGVILDERGSLLKLEHIEDAF